MLKSKFLPVIMDTTTLNHIKNDPCLKLCSQINPAMLDIIYLYNGY